jgi:SagB-type dehydrogenase family enzyme
VKLPPPKRKGTLSLEEILEKRRSKRRFLPRRLSREQISQLLWAAQGVLQRGLRTAPSAGALYPLEIYVAMKEGVYHYAPQKHELEQVVQGNILPELSKAALDQEFIAEASVNIVIAAEDQRAERRYRDRAARYVCMEVGHVAQNIHLQAVALGLGSVPVGAFKDDQVHQVLGLPPEQRPLYIIPVGFPAE